MYLFVGVVEKRWMMRHHVDSGERSGAGRWYQDGDDENQRDGGLGLLSLERGK